MNKPVIDQLVDRFLACPLPESVKVDPCAMPEVIPYCYGGAGTTTESLCPGSSWTERTSNA